MSAQSLSGRMGLVAGVSSELSVGFRCAQDLVARGAEVVVTYRPKPDAAAPELARRLGCRAVEWDVASEGSLARAVQQVGAQFERLDFVVHTLVTVPEGVLQKPLTQLRREHFARVLDVGVYSLIELVRECGPLLGRSGSGRVVTLLSAGGDFVMPNYHAVGIAKAALAAALRYLAAEVADDGVLCNAVNFSLLKTSAAQRAVGDAASDRTVEHVRKRSMTHKQLDYDDVTAAIAYLCSDECRNMTGEVMNVDGGFSRSYF